MHEIKYVLAHTLSFSFILIANVLEILLHSQSGLNVLLNYMIFLSIFSNMNSFICMTVTVRGLFNSSCVTIVHNN